MLRAAFAGRTYSILQPVLATLPTALAERLAPRLLDCSTLRQLQSSVPTLLATLYIAPDEFGQPLPDVAERRKQSLGSLLSEELVAWSTTPSEQSAAAFLATLLPELTNAAAAAAPAPAPAVVAPTARLQANLSRLSNDTYKTAVRSALCGIADEADCQSQVARFISQGGLGASAFLAALPTHDVHRSMAPELFREALRRSLGIERPLPGGLCGNEHCQEAQTGPHARSCNRTGELNFRHNIMRDTVATLLTTTCGLAGVRTEDNQPFVDTMNGDSQIDITIEGGQMAMPSITQKGAPRVPPLAADAAKGGLLDISIVDPTCPSHRAASSRFGSGAGRAASNRAKAKYNTYLTQFSAASYILFPLVLESFGTACAHLHSFIHAVAERESQLSEGAKQVSWCKQRWRQRLSVTLQRGISLAVARCFSKTRCLPAVNGVHVPPDITAHLRLRLLVRPQPAVAVAVAVPVVVVPAVAPITPVVVSIPPVGAVVVAVGT